jgi:hypothetical protein
MEIRTIINAIPAGGIQRNILTSWLSRFISPSKADRKTTGELGSDGIGKRKNIEE